MKVPDRIRGQDGVVFNIKELPGGKLRITMNDVKNSSDDLIGVWKHSVIEPHEAYDPKLLRELELSESEYAARGHYE
jgi:hypothetical protein